MAVDASGNVIVTGYSASIGSAADYYTAKYAAANGALLWERRYNGPEDNTDVARAVVVDGSGNVIVTGVSFNDDDYYDRPTDPDLYTAKYAAASGALLWEQRYDGLANGNDCVSALAPGTNGTVAIAGYSRHPFDVQNYFYDYATVVYRDLPPPGSFAAWAASHGLTGAAAAADADPDNDGLPNSAEFILVANPTVPSTSPSPTATTSGSNTIFTFRRDNESENPDVSLTVESGTDLLTWPAVFNIGPGTAASCPGVTVTENGAAADTITVTIPHGTAARIFVRLNVAVTP